MIPCHTQKYIVLQCLSDGVTPSVLIPAFDYFFFTLNEFYYQIFEMFQFLFNSTCFQRHSISCTISSNFCWATVILVLYTALRVLKEPSMKNMCDLISSSSSVLADISISSDINFVSLFPVKI